MRLRPTCLGAILAGACVALVAPPRTAAESPAPAVPDLSGRWRLDPAQSVGEPAAAAPSAEAAAARKPEKAGAAEKADKPDPPGSSGAAAASREGAGQPVAELVVTQTEVEVTVEEKPGTTLHFYPNGRTYKADEGQSDIRSQWRDGKLVFEKKSQQGWKLTQTWQVAPDRSRLIAELHVEGRGRPKANIKRVYQRVETTP